MSKRTAIAGAQPRRQSSWDWRAAGNFIGGGSGSGVLVLGFVAALTGLPIWTVVLLGGALIGGGLTCVWMEIGKPWRALHVFFHPQTSWMTREGIVALLLYAVAAGALLLNSIVLLGLLALVACGFIYCQARILVSTRGIPAWREPALLPLILVTAATEGAGLVLVLAAAFGGRSPIGYAALPLLLLLAGRGFGWRGYYARLRAGAAPSAAVAVATRLNLPFILVGNLLPALLAGLALVVPGWMAPVAAGILAAAGGWLFKFTLVTRMAMTQGFALPATPSRGRGTTGPGIRPGWSKAP